LEFIVSRFKKRVVLLERSSFADLGENAGYAIFCSVVDESPSSPLTTLPFQTFWSLQETYAINWFPTQYIWTLNLGRSLNQLLPLRSV